MSDITPLLFFVEQGESDDARNARWDKLVLSEYAAGREIVGGGPDEDEPFSWVTPEGEPWDGTTFPYLEVWGWQLVGA